VYGQVDRVKKTHEQRGIRDFGDGPCKFCTICEAWRPKGEFYSAAERTRRAYEIARKDIAPELQGRLRFEADLEIRKNAIAERASARQKGRRRHVDA
jgi:hypothetical protein